uniref:Uncharacterized protein n=1 Tax=Rhizophora mucronata TaxID=61149 RepID=A0A2P2MAV4_RHIMU
MFLHIPYHVVYGKGQRITSIFYLYFLVAIVRSTILLDILFHYYF